MTDNLTSPWFRRRADGATAAVRRVPRDGRTLHEAEDAIADLTDVERAYFFDPAGRQIALFEGDSQRIVVALTARERRRLRDGVFLHNHPPHDPMPAEHPLFGFTSFSPADIILAKEWDVARAMVVTARWRFELRRPAAGWTAVFGDDFDDLLRSLWALITDADEQGDVEPDLRRDRRATRSDRVSERFADEIGAVYRKERR